MFKNTTSIMQPIGQGIKKQRKHLTVVNKLAKCNY